MEAALKHLQNDMIKCFRCSLCKMIPLPTVFKPEFTENCPINRFYHFHGISGSGWSIAANAVCDGRIKADKTLADAQFTCTTCGYCDVACKYVMDAERHLINMALREHLVDEGFAPEVHVKAMENLRTKGHISGDLSRSPGAWAEGLGLKVLPRQKAKVLLYAGCAQRNDLGYGEVVRKLARLLVEAGVDVGILGDSELCCALPAYQRGFRDLFTQKAAQVTSLLDDTGAKTIVMAGGGCFGAVRSKYDQYGSKPKAEVLHATEMLLQLIKKGKLKLNKRIDAKVTYHDPCYLGRQSEVREKWVGEEKTEFGQMVYTDPPKPIHYGTKGVYDPPREILKAIKGIEFNEMYRIREYAFCCGAGGGALDTNPEMSISAAQYRLAEARDVGADVLVTACPHCESHFVNDAKDADGAIKNMKVLDIIDLVFQAAAIKL